MRYWLGPWSTDEDGGNVAPPGVVGLVNLTTPIAPDRVFFATLDGVNLGPRHVLLGEGSISSISGHGPSWAAATGVVVGPGETLLDSLWNLVTVHADPDGASRPRPAMPTSRGRVNLWLGGHGLIRSVRFDAESPEFAAVLVVKQEQYRSIREAARAGLLNRDAEFHRRVLGYWGEKYGVRDPENRFIPADLSVESGLPHRTRVQDSFNKTDEDLETSTDWVLRGDLGGGAPSLAVVSGRCREDTTTPFGSWGQFQTALSSDDHFSEVSIEKLEPPGSTRNFGAAWARCDVSAGNNARGYFYEATIDSAGVKRGRLRERNSGSSNTLVDEVETIGPGSRIRCVADGSDISGRIDGIVTAGPVTDVSFSGELTVGLGSRIQQGSVGDVEMDNFVGGDNADNLVRVATLQEGAGKQVFVSSGVQTLDDPEQSGDGVVQPEGSGAQSLADVEQQGSGLLVVLVSGSQVLSDPRQQGTGVTGAPQGDGDQTLDAPEQQGAGVVQPEGSAAQLLAEVAQAAQAEEALVGTAAQMLADLTQQGVGALLHAGQGQSILETLKQAGVGQSVTDVDGAGDQVLALVVQVGSGVAPIIQVLTLDELFVRLQGNEAVRVDRGPLSVRIDAGDIAIAGEPVVGIVVSGDPVGGIVIVTDEE